MKNLVRLLSLLLLAQLLPFQIAAQEADSVKVSLVTIYPGNEIFQVYGHTELRVQNDKSDWYYNYGVFDFSSPNFAMRFLAGETDYICAAVPPQYAIGEYEGRRKIVEQELNLTQEQATKVADFLSNNAKPENAVYRYKFFTDNCATRPRDIIEYALGDELEFGEGETSTYRKLVSTCNANYKWNEFGIDMVLGTPADTTIELREQMFVPMILMKAVGDAKVRREGTVEPLVRETRVMVDGSDEGDVAPPTPFLLSPIVVALLLLIVVALISWRAFRRNKLSRWFASLLFLAAGLAGTVIFYFTFFSTHEATSLNVNVLWLNPLYLLLAVLVWFRGSKLLRVCSLIQLALTLLALVLFIFGVQHANAAFYPIILALLLQLGRYSSIIYVDPPPFLWKLKDYDEI